MLLGLALMESDNPQLYNTKVSEGLSTSRDEMNLKGKLQKARLGVFPIVLTDVVWLCHLE